MHQRLELLNYQLRLQRLPTIKFGIGIHTGPLVGGTVGNRHRLNYSLFGDTVNVAARIESLTKTLPENAPFKLLVSGDTRHYTQAQFPLDRVQSAKLRGRKGSIEVYTLAAQLDVATRPTSPSVVTPIERVQLERPPLDRTQIERIQPDISPPDISRPDISRPDISQWDAS